MPIGVCYGRSSKTGFATAMMRDLDVLAPRPPLPKRALPDCVRVKLGLTDAAVASALAPSAYSNGGIIKTRSMKNSKTTRQSAPAAMKKAMKF